MFLQKVVMKRVQRNRGSKVGDPGTTILISLVDNGGSKQDHRHHKFSYSQQSFPVHQNPDRIGSSSCSFVFRLLYKERSPNHKSLEITSPQVAMEIAILRVISYHRHT